MANQTYFNFGENLSKSNFLFQDMHVKILCESHGLPVCYKSDTGMEWRSLNKGIFQCVKVGVMMATYFPNTLTSSFCQLLITALEWISVTMGETKIYILLSNLN